MIYLILNIFEITNYFKLLFQKNNVIVFESTVMHKYLGRYTSLIRFVRKFRWPNISVSVCTRLWIIEHLPKS